MGRDLDRESPAPRRKPKRRRPDRGADACPVLITMAFALSLAVTWIAS